MVSRKKLGTHGSLVKKGKRNEKDRVPAFFLLLVAFFLGEPGFASEKEKEFQKIAKLGEWVLTIAAKEALGEKVPGRKMGGLSIPQVCLYP